MRDKYSESNHKATLSQDLGYDFETPATCEVYRELMAIAREIELCRASL